MSDEQSRFTVPWTQRTFTGMYAMVERSFGEYSGPFVCNVQCIDDDYIHDSDIKEDMTFKITGKNTEASPELVCDYLWGTNRDNNKPLGTYGFDSVWEKDMGQCYFAVSECAHMTARMMDVWHFPYIEDKAIYGDSIVFVRT